MFVFSVFVKYTSKSRDITDTTSFFEDLYFRIEFAFSQIKLKKKLRKPRDKVKTTNSKVIVLPFILCFFTLSQQNTHHITSIVSFV